MKAIFSHKSKIPLIRVNGLCCRLVQDLCAEKSQNGNSCCGAEPHPAALGLSCSQEQLFPGWKNALEWLWGHTQSSKTHRKTCAVMGRKTGLRSVPGESAGGGEDVKLHPKNPKKHFYKTKIISGSCSRSQTERTAHTYIDISL